MFTIDGALTGLALAVMALVLLVGATVSWPIALTAGLIAAVALGVLASILTSDVEDDDYEDEEWDR
ncbi:hypothetical protein ACIQFP_26660 [Nocardiopsis alba]|uniref:hypothetical protein n=1 Tax=Nocardiopsis alba TaxID=53437 RepID=UPI0037F150E7